MVSLKFSSLFGAAMLALAPVVASAADLPEPPLVEIDPYDEPSGWYLRGDVGFVASGDPDTSYLNNGSTTYLEWEDLENTFVVGVGAGYQVNEWFRTDITVDYRANATFKGLGPCSGCPGPYSNEKTSIESYTALWNAYVEYEVARGLTPYLGAGIGVAYVDVGSHLGINPNGTVTPFGGNGSWNFAWALMAGVTLDVNEQLAMDLNYRYVNLGEVESAAASGGDYFKHDDLDAHEVRLGFRYSLN